MENAEASDGAETAQQVALCALIGTCSYNFLKSGYFFTFMAGSSIEALPAVSTVLNGAGVAAGVTLLLSSALRSSSKKTTIEDMLKKIEALAPTHEV